MTEIKQKGLTFREKLRVAAALDLSVKISAEDARKLAKFLDDNREQAIQDAIKPENPPFERRWQWAIYVFFASAFAFLFV